MKAVHRGIAAGIFLVAACGDDVFGPIGQLPRPLSIAEQALVANTNAFGFDFFQRVHASERAPNLFVSPLSAAMALGMTMNGAAGDTWNEMRHGLRLDGLTEDEINDSFRGLMDLLLDLDPRVTLRIGNSIWSRQGIPFEADFFSRARNSYDAEARELDFGDPRSLNIINNWAKNATNGRIEKVLDRIDPSNIMFLLNAIYFKGTWERRFDRDQTRPAPFTRADGSHVEVPMMRLPKGAVLHTGSTNYRAIELPYGGGAFAMVIVLPSGTRTLSSLVSSLDAAAWNALVAGLDSVDLEVRLPRFRYSYEKLLNEPLQEFGMRVPFSTQADFTRLTPLARTNPVCIHFVKQNTFVEVNEEGTEAAAVTTVGIGVVSAGPQPFTVDRPFLFAIRERFSGTVLFMGTIGDPTLVESEPTEDPPPPCSS